MGVASAADALPPVAQPLGSGAFCDGAPTDNPFSDLTAEPEATRDAILCLVATDLTQGATTTTYAPRANVTRRQMSLFVQRLRSEEHTSELQSLMRISYAVFCL